MAFAFFPGGGRVSNIVSGLKVKAKATPEINSNMSNYTYSSVRGDETDSRGDVRSAGYTLKPNGISRFERSIWVTVVCMLVVMLGLSLVGQIKHHASSYETGYDTDLGPSTVSSPVASY